MREDVLLRIKLINQRGSAEGLRQELERGIETTHQPIPTSADLPLSGEGRRVVARADEEAETLKHRSIDSSHLVLGVFAMNGKAAATLDHQGIGYEAGSPECFPALDTSGRKPPGLFPSLLGMTPLSARRLPPLSARRLLRPCGRRFPSWTNWWPRPMRPCPA